MYFIFGLAILITETTYQDIQNEFVCRPMPEATLRGKTKPLSFYEVISFKAQ